MTEANFVGTHTLKIISKSSAFNHWLYQQLKPFIHGRVLEIGSGIGNISQYILADQFSTTLSDINPEYISILKAYFSSNPNFVDAEQIDLMLPPSKQECYDTIIAVNVIEHILDDNKAIMHINQLLKPGGTFITLVPAYPFLYCKFDRMLGHFRRYTRPSLSQKLTSAGFQIMHSQNFNLLGIAGWLFFGKILQRPMIEENQMAWFDKLVPLAKMADRFAFKKVGLSVICVGKKN